MFYLRTASIRTRLSLNGSRLKVQVIVLLRAIENHGIINLKNQFPVIEFKWFEGYNVLIRERRKWYG